MTQPFLPAAPDFKLSDTVHVPRGRDLQALQDALSNADRSVSILNNKEPMEVLDDTGTPSYIPPGYLVSMRQRTAGKQAFQTMDAKEVELALQEVCRKIGIETPDIQYVTDRSDIRDSRVYIGLATMGKLCDAAKSACPAR